MKRTPKRFPVGDCGRQHLRDLRQAALAGFAAENTVEQIDRLLLDLCDYVRRPEVSSSHL